MTVRINNATGAYRVAAAPGSWRTSALVLAPLIDEWTAAAPTAVEVRSLTPNTAVHITAGTLVVTGLPELALPGLAAAAADVVVQVRRVGRPIQQVTITVPLGSSTPYTAPAVVLESSTILLAGRITAADFPNDPVAGAAVALSGVGSHLLPVSVPLALDHDEGATVRERALTAGAATALDAPARAGQRVLRVASTAGIAAGTVLSIGGDLLVADATNGPLVLLRTPLAISAPAGAPVTAQAFGPVGVSVQLRRSAKAGDGLLPVSAALTAAAVEVADGTATEFRRTTLSSDADGRWALAGVRGIPEVAVTISAAGFISDGPRRRPLAPIDPFILNTALRT